MPVYVYAITAATHPLGLDGGGVGDPPQPLRVVRDTMEERAGAYQERLEALEGCAGFHLKVSCDEEALLREVPRESDDARRMNEDLRRGHGGQELKPALGKLVADEVGRRHESFASGIVDALRPSAREVRLSEAAGEVS
ncbi:GvpL/GvpF family gas vesicle protein [Streptomyces sp. NPDC093546]|uniref:GvpL/GvpF family gas vesicle protein n=1 Tax=Streptomyces sp. NPDC093546 TaxID=3366040 RepID=UPI0038085CD1